MQSHVLTLFIWMDRREQIISSCQQVTFKLHSAGRCRLALRGCVHFKKAIFKIFVVFLDLLLFLRISSDKYKPVLTNGYQHRSVNATWKCLHSLWDKFDVIFSVFQLYWFVRNYFFQKVGSFRYRALGSARLPWNALQPKWAATELNWSPQIWQKGCLALRHIFPKIKQKQIDNKT